MYRSYQSFISQILSLILLGLLLSACSSSSGDADRQPVTPPSAFGKLEQKSDWYLSQLAKSDPAYRFAWEILAARSLLENGDLQQASAISQQLKKEAFTPKQKYEQHLVAAMLLQRQAKPEDALQRLSKIDSRPLDNDATATYYRLQASLLSQTDNPLQAVSAYIALEHYLSKDEKSANHNAIWTLLLSQSTQQLHDAQDKPAPDIRSGWLELAQLQQQYANQPNEFAHRYEFWQKQYPHHPASELFTQLTPPKDSQTAADQSSSGQPVSSLPKRVAIMIPLTGQLAAQGDALRNGMLTAYKEANLQTDLRFYDSNSQPIANLYQQAKQDGAEFIVGPLLKDQVDSLLAQQPNMPVMALNDINSKQPSASQFYFSLSPNEDAADAANQIQNDGKNLPLLVVPAGPQGQRIIDNFNQEWAKHAKTSPVVARFADRQSLEAVLHQAMGVNIDLQRQLAKQRKISQETATQAFNRTDVDAIYIYASPLEASIIKSFIDNSQNPYAQRSPTYYLGSRGNPGITNAAATQNNVAGMRLGDMPWLTEQQQPLRDKVLSVWPQMNTDLLRFFAMGYDAVSLLPRLGELRGNQSQSQQGLTGKLSIDDSGVIHRQLNWITVTRNEAANAPAPTAAPAAEQP